MIEETARLRPLPETKAPDHITIERKVNIYSAIDLYSCHYSVPCQAIGKTVNIRLYSEHLEIYGETGKLLAK